MENIIRKIRTYYPVSDEALEALVCLFERWVFPAKTTIIQAGFPGKGMPFVAPVTYITARPASNM